MSRKPLQDALRASQGALLLMWEQYSMVIDGRRDDMSMTALEHTEEVLFAQGLIDEKGWPTQCGREVVNALGEEVSEPHQGMDMAAGARAFLEVLHSRGSN